jgi:hypothetical protein
MSDAQASPSPSAVPNSGQQVSIKYGVYNEKMPPNTTVAAARERINRVTTMSADTQAFVNGQRVNEDSVLEPGATLQFMKRTGEKGQLA